jgi:RimJ/RimL family protein N-acetyltransferase
LGCDIAVMLLASTTSIAADGLVLRVLHAGDAQAVVEATLECDDAVWVPQHPPYAVAEAREFLAEYDRRRERGEAVSFGVFGSDSEMLLAGLVVQQAAPGDVELAYWVRPDYRGRGIAARSLDALSDWVESRLGPHRLWVEVARSNQASLRTAANAGYRPSGMKGGKVVLVRTRP